MRKRFSQKDVLLAILATGWLSEDGSELRFKAKHPLGKTLSDVIEEMLGYFEAPDNPSKELLHIQAVVADDAGDGELTRNIPLYAYAFLDILLRNDLAEEARSADEIWHPSQIAIELDCLRDKRVKELLSRYSKQATGAASRLAGSMSTREANKSQETRAS